MEGWAAAIGCSVSSARALEERDGDARLSIVLNILRVGGYTAADLHEVLVPPTP